MRLNHAPKSKIIRLRFGTFKKGVHLPASQRIMKKLLLLSVLFAALTSVSKAQQVEMSVQTLASVCGIQQGKLSPAQIIEAGKITANAENMKVAGFIMTVYNEKGIENYSSSSDQLTPQMIASLSKTKEGELVKFSQVVLISKSKTYTRSKEPINIEIAK